MFRWLSFPQVEQRESQGYDSKNCGENPGQYALPARLSRRRSLLHHRIDEIFLDNDPRFTDVPQPSLHIAVETSPYQVKDSRWRPSR